MHTYFNVIGNGNFRCRKKDKVKKFVHFLRPRVKNYILYRFGPESVISFLHSTYNIACKVVTCVPVPKIYVDKAPIHHKTSTRYIRVQPHDSTVLIDSCFTESFTMHYPETCMWPMAPGRKQRTYIT